MKHYTVLEPASAARLIDSNRKIRDTVGKTLSTQIVRSFDGLLLGNWYDPSIETLRRVTDIAVSVLSDRTDIEGLESIITPDEIAGWLKNNHDKFFAVAHYVDCSRGALYHYEKTGRDTLSHSITAGVSYFIHDQSNLKDKQEAL